MQSQTYSIYADMELWELRQRRDALESLVAGTDGRKQRRYALELEYVCTMIIEFHTRPLQMEIPLDMIG